MRLALLWINPLQCYLSFEFFVANYFLVVDFYLLVVDFYLLMVDFYLLAEDSYFVAVGFYLLELGFYFLAVILAALVQPGVRLLVLSQYRWHYTRECYKDMP